MLFKIVGFQQNKVIESKITARHDMVNGKTICSCNMLPPVYLNNFILQT